MHRLHRLARSVWSPLPLTLWCCVVSSCSAGGGQSQTTEASAASDGVMRTANGQIIRDPAAPPQGASTGDGSDAPPSTAGAEGGGSEVLGSSDVALNQPDAGLERGDPDDDTPPGPAASPDPVAPPEPSEDEDEDEDDD